MEIWDQSPYFQDSYGCDRCEKSDVCHGCINDVPMAGYWMDEWYEHNKICKDCYDELSEEFRGRWESEFGNERKKGLENPY
jgi:hypothetical protein